MPEGAELEPDLGVYWDAWQSLRDDRHYGAMSGMGRIYYRAVSQYAADYGIAGVAFDVLKTLVFAMDHEFMDWSAERAKEEAEKAKRGR